MRIRMDGHGRHLCHEKISRHQMTDSAKGKGIEQAIGGIHVLVPLLGGYSHEERTRLPEMG